MKKVILLSLLGAMMGLQVQAQVNPQKGYLSLGHLSRIRTIVDPK